MVKTLSPALAEKFFIAFSNQVIANVVQKFEDAEHNNLLGDLAKEKFDLGLYNMPAPRQKRAKGEPAPPRKIRGTEKAKSKLFAVGGTFKSCFLQIIGDITNWVLDTLIAKKSLTVAHFNESHDPIISYIAEVCQVLEGSMYTQIEKGDHLYDIVEEICAFIESPNKEIRRLTTEQNIEVIRSFIVPWLSEIVRLVSVYSYISLRMTETRIILDSKLFMFILANNSNSESICERLMLTNAIPKKFKKIVISQASAQNIPAPIVPDLDDLINPERQIITKSSAAPFATSSPIPSSITTDFTEMAPAPVSTLALAPVESSDNTPVELIKSSDPIFVFDAHLGQTPPPPSYLDIDVDDDFGDDFGDDEANNGQVHITKTDNETHLDDTFDLNANGDYDAADDDFGDDPDAADTTKSIQITHTAPKISRSISVNSSPAPPGNASHPGNASANVSRSVSLNTTPRRLFTITKTADPSTADTSFANA